jgi:hypothetical protein
MFAPGRSCGCIWPLLTGLRLFEWSHSIRIDHKAWSSAPKIPPPSFDRRPLSFHSAKQNANWFTNCRRLWLGRAIFGRLSSLGNFPRCFLSRAGELTKNVSVKNWLKRKTFGKSSNPNSMNSQNEAIRQEQSSRERGLIVDDHPISPWFGRSDPRTTPP